MGDNDGEVGGVVDDGDDGSKEEEERVAAQRERWGVLVCTWSLRSLSV